MKAQETNNQNAIVSNDEPLMSYCDEGGIKTTKITRSISSNELIEIIQSDDLKKRTETFRKASSSEAKEIKYKMPYIVPGGTFNGRRGEENLLKRSGFVGLDFDKVPNVEQKLNELRQDEIVHIAKTSISNRGLHVIVKVNTLDADHKVYVRSLSSYFLKKYGLEIDKAVSNVASSLILSYSQDIVHNSESEVVGQDFIDEYPVKSTQQTTTLKATKFKKINLTETNRKYYGDLKLKWVKERIETCEEGTKHTTLLKCATAIGTYVAYQIVEIDDAVTMLREAINERKETVSDMKEAYKTIENGIKHGMENPFDILTEIVPEDRKWWYTYVQRKEVCLGLSFVDVYDFFERAGYHIMKRGAGDIFIHVNENVIDEVTETTLIQHLTNEIESLPYYIGDGFTRVHLKQVFLGRISQIFNPRRLKTWKMFEPNLVRDTKDKSYYFFNNGFMEISKEGKSLKPYSELSGQIWRTQIKDRDISNLTSDTAHFAKFLERVAEYDPLRFKGLRSLIAYTMHGYKDPVEPRATIFVDELISEHPNGGTGKGLVIDAISRLREVTILDGKSFKFDRFAYQRVTQQTQVLVYEDITASFQFEKLFAVMSNGMTIEKKNEHEYFIPMRYAPKILLTSNYAVGGEGNSNKRRQYLIEFSQHYNSLNPPIKEFNHRFFEDWDDEEWNNFDNFMMDCVVEYLKDGVVLPPPINVEKKKLMQLTNKRFMEYAFNEIQLGERYDRDIMIETFNEEYGGQIVDTPGGVRKFNEWIDAFVAIMDWHLEKGRGGSNTHKYTFYESQKSAKEAQDFIEAKTAKMLEAKRDQTDANPEVPSSRGQRRARQKAGSRLEKLARQATDSNKS